MSTRRRLDTEMVRRGMVPSRTGARHLIDDRRVLVGGSLASKASRLVHPAEAVVLAGDPPRFVSRGGEKLEAALDAFAIDPSGLRAIDAGASTGGFTDCLLQQGAAAVVAVDVGRNQLHERLRAHPRVVSLERTDVRSVAPASIGGPVPLVAADLSFISLRAVVPHLRRLASADLIVLVKPQFEAGKAAADRSRGVIRDPDVWRRALNGVCGSITDSGAAVMGIVTSPITGAAGNVEFLVHADVRPGARSPADLSESVERAVRSARSAGSAGWEGGVPQRGGAVRSASSAGSAGEGDRSSWRETSAGSARV